MTLREFIKLYNFRVFVNDKENTQIIRIYTDFPRDWFEFGVNDWGYDDTRDERVETFITKKVLDLEVDSFQYDDVNEVFAVTLEWPEEE